MRWLAAVVLSSALLTGCNFQGQCAAVPPPTENEIAAAAEGAEVERQDCELQNGHWMPEEDE